MSTNHQDDLRCWYEFEPIRGAAPDTGKWSQVEISLLAQARAGGTVKFYPILAPHFDTWAQSLPFRDGVIRAAKEANR
jgi:hypothetical protein